jgi:hypothetical protein
MAGVPQTYDSIRSVPLAVDFDWRGTDPGTQQADAWAKNVFTEGDSEGGGHSVKRPGLKSVGNCSGALGGTLLVAAGQEASFIQFSNFHPGQVVGVGNGKYFRLLTGDMDHQYTSGGPTPTVTNPTGDTLPTFATRAITSTDVVLCWAVLAEPPAGSSQILTATGGLFVAIQCASGVIFGNWTNGLRLYTARSVAQALVPGIVTLKGLWYVLDVQGKIWASDRTAAPTWPVLNYIAISNSIGAGVALGKLGDYLVAFGVLGYQFFYDAGVSPGAPILPVENGTGPCGMSAKAPMSLASSHSSLFWVGTAITGGLCIYQLTGTAVAEISTPGVNRFLTALFANLLDFGDSGVYPAVPAPAAVRGSVFRSAGHEFYALTVQAPSASAVGTGGETLVYNITTKNWNVWSQQTTYPYGEGALRAVSIVAPTSEQAQFPDPTGPVLELDEGTYQDNGQQINVLIQTPNYSWGNQRIKIFAATYPLLDTVSSMVSLSWTDDDYTTFSSVQMIDTTTSKKQLVRCGSAVRRAWQLTHIGNTPMRFYSLEVEVMPGAL